jgi:hypoxia up-regulated 1
MFGSDATALMARKPELTFAKTFNVLGKTPAHPVVNEIKKQYFPYEMYTNETLGVTCLKQEETYYTPEELVAMILQHAKDMTANFGGKVIRDCVITVPSSFTQHERKALFTAAEIADLKVLSLIEENTAAALHYGIDRGTVPP